jgi:flagellar motility protein MotE (MotC chaperone)
MSKKNTPAVTPVNPADELEALKAQRIAIDAEIKTIGESWKKAQVAKKDLQDKIKSLYGTVVESRKTAKAEKAAAQIEALQARLATLTGSNV